MASDGSMLLWDTLSESESLQHIASTSSFNLLPTHQQYSLPHISLPDSPNTASSWVSNEQPEYYMGPYNNWPTINYDSASGL